MAKKVRLLNVDVDDITLDELVDSFQEGLLLTLHVDMIMKLQKDREFYEILPNFDAGHLRQPDPGRGGEDPGHAAAGPGLGVGLLPALLPEAQGRSAGHRLPLRRRPGRRRDRRAEHQREGGPEDGGRR